MVVAATTPTEMSKKQDKEEVKRRSKSKQEQPGVMRQGARMSVIFSNPDYLLEGYAEKKCMYIGKIDDMPVSADISDRGYLLTQLDNKRNSGRLPWTLNHENAISLTISAYNLKIISENKDGRVLHRIPIHEVASASYVNDDNTHLVFILAGDAQQARCPCHIFNCSKRADAEEICTILQQAFQLVYTEATMEHFNDSITAGEKGFRNSRSSLVLVPKAKPSAAPNPQQQKESEAQRHTTPLVAQTLEEDEREEKEVQGEASAVEIVQNYMERLHDLLDFKELREFANLLKRYREDLKVEEFLEKLKKLYGAQREFLIPDMRSFIPEEDVQKFESFLSSLNSNSNHSAEAHQATPPSTEARPPPTDIDSFQPDTEQQTNILTTNF